MPFVGQLPLLLTEVKRSKRASDRVETRERLLTEISVALNAPPVPAELTDAHEAFREWLVLSLFDLLSDTVLKAVALELRDEELRDFGRLVVGHLFGYFVARAVAGLPTQLPGTRGRLLSPEPSHPQVFRSLVRGADVMNSIRAGVTPLGGRTSVLDALVAAAKGAAEPRRSTARRRRGAPGNVLNESAVIAAVIAASLPNGPRNLKDAAKVIAPLFEMTSFEAVYTAIRKTHADLGSPKRHRESALALVLSRAFAPLQVPRSGPKNAPPKLPVIPRP